MRYLITFTKPGNEPFLTRWFDYDNHYNPDLGMIIFDLEYELYSTNGKDWQSIPQDHL